MIVIKNTGMMLIAVALLPAIAWAAPAPTTAPDERPAGEKDALQAKTNWKGREFHLNRKSGKGAPVSARVTQRKGNEFTLNYWTVSDDGRKGVQLEGTIDDKGVIRAKAVKVLPGDDWHETVVGTYFTGSIDGKTLILNRNGHRGSKLKGELTLQGKD